MSAPLFEKYCPKGKWGKIMFLVWTKNCPMLIGNFFLLLFMSLADINTPDLTHLIEQSISAFKQLIGRTVSS